MAYERIWQRSLNTLYVPTSDADATKYMVWFLKAALLGQIGGFTQGLWTTYSSNDGNGNFGNGDLVDRWGATYDPTKIVQAGAGVNHSWYVLKSPLMNGINWYLLLTMNTGVASAGTTIFAKSPFVGGTATADPTSPDSWTIFSTASTWASGGNGIPFRFNVILSTLGDFVYFPLKTSDGFLFATTIAVVAPADVHPSDNYPIWTYRNWNASNPGSFDSTLTTAATNNNTRLSNGNAASCFIIGSPGGSVGGTAPIERKDMLTGKYATCPTYLLANQNVGSYHLRGRLADILFLPQSTPGNGVSGIVLRDVNNDIEYVTIGSLYLPLNALPLT